MRKTSETKPIIFLKAIVLIALIILFPYPTYSNTLEPRSCLTVFLTKTAYTYDEHRQEDQLAFWKEYKNNDSFAAWIQVQDQLPLTPTGILEQYNALKHTLKHNRSIAPRTVDLSDPLGSHPPANPTSISPPIRESRGARMQALSQYDLNVLMLRKGDTVDFGVRRFVLGEFLGAGNATHVYALAGDPKKVIRIPFMADGSPVAQETGNSGIKRILRGRKLIETLSLNRPGLPKSLNPVQIYDTGKDSQFAYAVVERVQASFDGEQFLKRIFRDTHLNKEEFTLDDISKLPDHTARTLMIKGLMPFIILRALRAKNDTISTEEKFMRMARQLVWVESENKWRLVDWE